MVGRGWLNQAVVGHQARQWALLAVAGGWLSGCGATDRPITFASSPRPADLKGVDASLESIPTPTAGGLANPLALQSQRDVDAVLNASSRRAVTSPNNLGIDAGGESALPSAPSLTSRTVPAARKPIIWNDPKPRSAASGAGTALPQPPALGAGHLPSSGAVANAGPAGSEAAATDPAATQPAATRTSLEPDRLKQLMVDLSRELYATGAYSDAPLRQLVMIAAMSMVDPDRKLEPQAIPDLTDKERELLGKLQTFFAELGRGLNSSSDLEQSIVESLGRLRASLVKEPQLKLARVALCTRVGGFGDYAPFDKLAFLAHSEQKAIVYLELEDFTSELNPKGEYVTQIAQQLTIYSDRDGIPVWKEDWQTAVDVTRHRRQDFFTVQVITLPKALSVGRYHLKVRVRDEKSTAEAENSLEFEMVADPRLAASVK
jgi:hypothetical protein